MKYIYKNVNDEFDFSIPKIRYKLYLTTMINKITFYDIIKI